MYLEFPAVHFGTIFSVGMIPAAGVQYVIDPLFKLILNGDDMADAEFVPVSIGFAVLSLVSLYMPAYNHFKLGKPSQVAPVENEKEVTNFEEIDLGKIDS